MGFDRVDILDELALYPERRSCGMSLPALLGALGHDISLADRLNKMLGGMRGAGLVRREGTRRHYRWFITERGMNFQPDADWSGERWGAFNDSERPWGDKCSWDEAA